MIQDEIRELKKKTNTVILAHYYEDGEVQDLADFVGDSFQLSQFAQTVKEPNILFCGVYFMAESVKIMNPDKRVTVPDPAASCSLVEVSPYGDYLKWRQAHPEAIAVTYINSSAEVKSISDVIITSSNAEKIIKSIPESREILFGPDQHLGRYISQKLNRKFHLWPGSCQVHVLFNVQKLLDLQVKYPQAVVLAHPECDQSLLKYAHVIGSTSRLIEEVRNNPAKQFIVATESGIFHQMKKLRSDVELIQAPTQDEGCACNDCPYMKLNTLEKIKESLLKEKYVVDLDESLRKKSLVSLERMMSVAAGEAIRWPETFKA